MSEHQPQTPLETMDKIPNRPTLTTGLNSIIIETAARALLPLLLLFSIFVLLRGHNDPGGGFVGGLVAGSAFALHSFAFGVDVSRKTLRFSPRLFMAFGLLIAVCTGIFSLFLGDPFLTGQWAEEIVLPAIGKLGTPFFFDVGVYFVVIGVVVTFIFTLFEDAHT